MADEDFVPPVVQIGDPVYWHSDVMSQNEPCIGWISSKPGAVTATVLVFIPDAGFTEKVCVRHKDDPGLQENHSWRQWGCWEIAPWFEQVKKVAASRASLIAESEREARKNGK